MYSCDAVTPGNKHEQITWVQPLQHGGIGLDLLSQTYKALYVRLQSYLTDETNVLPLLNLHLLVYAGLFLSSNAPSLCTRPKYFMHFVSKVISKSFSMGTQVLLLASTHDIGFIS